MPTPPKKQEKNPMKKEKVYTEKEFEKFAIAAYRLGYEEGFQKMKENAILIHLGLK